MTKNYNLIRLFAFTVCALFALVSLPIISSGAQKAYADESPKSYIVVLKDSASSSRQHATRLANKHQVTVGSTYQHVIKGFQVTATPSEAEALRRDSQVDLVMEDGKVRIASQSLPTGIRRINAPANTVHSGTGVGVAVLDTGIDLDHPDLAGNIVGGKNCIDPTRSADDDNGHGSHVAGTIAALDNGDGVVGVAPQAKLLAVKVLNSSGSGLWSQVICGIDWVTANASRYNIKVANMSLTGTKPGGSSGCGWAYDRDAVHRSICSSTAAGVTYVVAAGNNGANASSYAPAGYNDTVITVSALADSDGRPGRLGSATYAGPDDSFATFSNFGSVVDIGAPGVDINSTWKNGGYKTISGTSMASPHVAGSAAIYIQTHPGLSWSSVRTALINAGESGAGGTHTTSGTHREPVVLAGSL